MKMAYWKWTIAALSCFLVCQAGLLAQGVTASVNDPGLENKLRELVTGERVLLSGLDLYSGQPAAELDLRRFEVFTSDARIVVHGEAGEQVLPAPANLYMGGGIKGDPQSRALLTILEDGTMRGLIHRPGHYWILGAGQKAGVLGSGLYVRAMEPEELEGPGGVFNCSSDELPGIGAATKRKKPARKAVPKTVYRGGSATYEARIAIESDWEYYNNFGNTTDATNYAGDLIAYSSVMYTAELDTSMSISHLSLWTMPGDPWAEFSTVCGLFEFGRYWNDNNGAIDRTAAHFLSGKSNGGGVAWVGVLCSGPFNTNTSGAGCGLAPAVDNYGGAYGYSGDLNFNFDINNPSSVWDIVVVAHEIGHNFNSPHTMCYAGLEGNPNHIDTCADQCNNASCHCGANALPSGCPGNGMGCGTIMSYCHFLTGGLANVALTLGLGHPYGIAPERVPTRMGNHVVTMHGIDPDCLEPQSLPYETQLALWPDGITVIDLINAHPNLFRQSKSGEMLLGSAGR